MHNRGGKTSTHDYHDDIDNDEKEHRSNDDAGNDSSFVGQLLDALRVSKSREGDTPVRVSLFF